MRPVFTDLGVLFDVPFPVEAMSPKRTVVRISLVVSFAVGALKGVRAWFALLGFGSGRINFSISFATPTEFSMMFRFVRPIAFDAFGSLDSTRECGMPPLPAIFALGDSWIHICSSNRSDIVAHIEAPVNEEFSILPALYIPNINPNNSHIGFWRDFDDPWFGCKRNI